MTLALQPGAVESVVDREGRRIAQLFRQYRGLADIRPCDLDAILAEDELEVCESWESDPGYTACLLRAPGERGGGIMLAPGQDSGRRRFSLAHELGHYHIPTHALRQPLGFCADLDMRRRRTDGKLLEWEANDFAAELLMPRRLFAKDVAGMDLSIAQAQRLAAPDMYHVSLTAAAWRMIQISREPCAMVVATAGRVGWVVRSDSFRLPLTDRDQQVHPDTLSASTARGEGAVIHPRKVPIGTWLEHAAAYRGRLLESTFGIPRLNQVVSVLWLIGSEDGGEDDDD